MIVVAKFNHLVMMESSCRAGIRGLNEGRYPRGLSHNPYFLPIFLSCWLWGEYMTFQVSPYCHKCLLVEVVVTTDLRILKRCFYGKFQTYTKVERIAE
jgi:hypothetical protein